MRFRPIFFVILLGVVNASPLAAADRAPQSDVTAIMAKVAERNEQRAAALQGYCGRRVYRLVYHGFPGDKEAEMVVTANYGRSQGKQFQIVSQQGPKFIQEKVFKRILVSEKEAMQRENREDTALTPRNYDFTLLGEEQGPGARQYVIGVSPRRNNKFLYRGRIWVDAEDYAVARIEAEPAKNPSFWTSQCRIRHVYRKVGDFWLPEENRSTSRIRLGGQATLTIEYLDYQLTDGSAPTREEAADPKPVIQEKESAK